MRKSPKKLLLNRETLRELNDSSLRGAGGAATGVSSCIHNCPTRGVECTTTTGICP